MTTMIGRAALKLRERYQHSAGKNWLCQQAERKLSAAQAALLHSGAIRSAAIIGKNWLCQQAEYKLSAAQAALLQQDQSCCHCLGVGKVRKDHPCCLPRPCLVCYGGSVHGGARWYLLGVLFQHSLRQNLHQGCSKLRWHIQVLDLTELPERLLGVFDAQTALC